MIDKSPKISIITVCYNAESTIKDTIDSVVNQNYDNIEYIIIDGKSKDKTLDIIKQYSNFVIILKSETDNGVYDAMNKGIQLSTGDWIIFLNSGDKFYDNSVLKKIFNYDIEENISAIYGNWINVKNNSSELCRPDPFFNHYPYSFNSGINHQSIFFNLDLAKKILYNTNYKISADYDFILNIYLLNNKFLYKDITISYYETSYGLSARNRDLAFKECALITHRNYGLKYHILLMFVKIKKRIKKTLKCS